MNEVLDESSERKKGRRVYNMEELEVVISFTYLLLAHSDKL